MFFSAQIEKKQKREKKLKLNEKIKPKVIIKDSE
jgi:hypothetical protein